MNLNKFLNCSCIHLFFLAIIIATNGCSTEESTLPFRNLSVRITNPIFVDKINYSPYYIPSLGNTVERDEPGEDSFIVVFHNYETKQIARTMAIAIRNRELDLEPKRYLSYPFQYTYMAAEMSAGLALTMLSGGSGYSGNGAVILLGFSAGVLTLGTTGGFLVGLGRGSYELTDDLWQGFTVNKKEIVLGYNDYEYDEEGRLLRVSSFLPYRPISNEAIPIYDFEGKKQIGNLFTKDEPVELFRLDYVYGKKAKEPSYLILKEFQPSLKTTKLKLPKV